MVGLRAGRPDRAGGNGWPGVWIDLHADVLCTLLRPGRPSAADLLGPYARPKFEAA